MKNSIKIAVFLLMSSVTSVVHAETMSCRVGVYKAADMIEESESGESSKVVNQIVKIPLTNGAADIDFQINGETVNVNMQKFEFVDMYESIFTLTTPVADLDPISSPLFVGRISDHLYNDGPTKENGWNLNPGPNATKFSFIKNRVGSFGLSVKMIKALKAAGKWGEFPFTKTLQMDLNYSYNIAEFVREQVEAKTMQPDDIVGLAAMLTCTREP